MEAENYDLKGDYEQLVLHSSSSSHYPYFLYIFSVSTVPLSSSIKLPICGNGQKW